MWRIVAALLLAGPGAGQQTNLAAEVSRANELMAQGRYADAATIYAAAVQALPDDPGLRTNLGMAYHLAGRDREAAGQFEAALRRQKGIVPALVMLGAAYLRLGEPAKAVPPLRELTTALPNLREGQQMLAEALGALGRHGEALPHYRRWTELDDSNPRAWYALGLAYDALADEAGRALEMAAPASAYTPALAASVLAARGQYPRAVPLYREALARDVSIPGLREAAARAEREAGQSERTASEASKETETVDCGRRPHACDFRAGRHEQVEIATRGASAPETLYWRARACMELAAKAFDRLENLAPSAQRFAVTGRRLRDRGAYGESIAAWKEALRLAPDDPVFEKELAVTLRLNEDYAAAQPLLEKLAGRLPDSAEINYLLGQVLLNQQQPGAALAYLNKAHTLEPAFLPVRSSLGLAYLQLDRLQEAVPHLEAALPIDQDGSLHFRLARAYQRLGKADLAKSTMERYQHLRKP
jgi:tetratricopeptide (TPR) repeat protein